MKTFFHALTGMLLQQTSSSIKKFFLVHKMNVVYRMSIFYDINSTPTLKDEDREPAHVLHGLLPRGVGPQQPREL